MDTAAEELNINVSIEEDGPSARKLTITVPSDVVDERIENAFGNLQLQAQLPGFRKGRAPRQLLEKRFGAQVIDEARGQLIMGAYQQAIKDHELKVVGDPEFADELMEKKLESGTEFAFDVSVEVVPEFDMPALEGVEIRKPIFVIEDQHIDDEIERLKYRFGSPEQITDGFQPLDRVLGKAVVDVEDHEGTFFETDKAVAVYPPEEDEGKGPVLGLMFEDLETKLKGTKVGDTVVFETTGPPAHERQELRDKKVTINLTIDDAERVTPLEMATLTATLGLEDETMLRERIRLETETRRDQEQRAAEREQVFEYLLDNTTLDLPKRISEAQVARSIERQRMELLYRGEDPETVEKQLAEMREQTQDQAINRLKLLFIMDKIARQFEIDVNDQEINGRIALIARQRGERPEAVRAELQKSGGLQEVARQIVEHKAADRIVDQASVTDIPADEWNEIAKEKAEARRTGGTTTKKKTTKKATAKKADSKKADSKKASSKKSTSKKKTTKKKA
jgi:trigger factor